jgi:hypothetical protein
MGCGASLFGFFEEGRPRQMITSVVHAMVFVREAALPSASGGKRRFPGEVKEAPGNSERARRA